GPGGVAAPEALEVTLPTGRPLVAADHVRFASGDRVLVNGPSGSGKSTLFRAIPGIWPFGTGRILLPADATVMVLPQRPYFPVGSLIAAVSYPDLPGRFTEGEGRSALAAGGLARVAPPGAPEGHWDTPLLLREAQRLPRPP